MAAMVHAFHAPDGTPQLGVVAKRAYRLAPGRRCVPANDDAEIVVQPIHRAAPHDEVELVHDTDLFALAKPVTDVVVDGSVHLGAAAAVAEASVEVGPVRKRLRVWGDRVVELDAQRRPRFSTPEPFTRMPLTWSRAYGGRDIAAEAALRRTALPRASRIDIGVVAYPRNPAGCGYRVASDASGLAGAAAPNFEDPCDPATADRLLSRELLDWIDRPAAAGFGPVDVRTFPRACFLLPVDHAEPTRPVHEIVCGAISVRDLEPRDLSTIDPRIYSCASPGLGRQRLTGGEPLRLVHLHPRQPALETQLPADCPQVLVEPPGAPIRRLAPRLATVLIQPDRDLVTLTWAASMATACLFPPDALERVRWGVTFAA